MGGVRHGSEIRVVKRAPRADPFPGFEDQAFAEEVKRLGCGGAEQVSQGSFWELSYGDIVGKLRVSWPVVFGRCPERSEDGFELVEVALAYEVGNSEHELGEDGAHGPNVDGRAIVARQVLTC